MPDREKVIKGLEHCGYNKKRGCVGCPYSDECGNFGRDAGMSSLATDALALLREQEPLTIHDPGAICPNCKWPLYPEDHPNYCGNCGKAVKWDATD